MTGTAADLPVSYWRGLLDSRWQAEVRRVTELSLAFCDAAENVRRFASPGGPDAGELQLAAGLLRRAENRAVAARRALADIEDAMARLSAGRFGRCEQCGTDMPARWLTRLPEARYCPRCSPRAAQIEVDVVALGPAEPGRPRRTLSVGEAKRDRVMDMRHVERLRRARGPACREGIRHQGHDAQLLFRRGLQPRTARRRTP